MRFSFTCLSVAFATLVLADKASSSQVDTVNSIGQVDITDRILNNQAKRFGNYYKGNSGTAWCANLPENERGPQVTDESNCNAAFQALKNSGFVYNEIDASSSNNSAYSDYPDGCYMRDGNRSDEKYFVFISNGANTRPNGNASLKPVCKSPSTNGSGTGGGSTPPGGSGTGGGSTPPGGSGSGGGSTPPGGSGTEGGSSPPGGSGSGGGSSPPGGSGTEGGSSPPGGSGSGGGSTPPGGSGTGGGSTPPGGSGSGGGGGSGSTSLPGAGAFIPVSNPVPEPDLCDSLKCPKNQCKIDGKGDPYCRCENTFVYNPSEKKCECPGGTELDKPNNRCFAPTSAPTSSPVDPPVEVPADPPVAAFIIDPPKSPTMSPVASASSVSDDPHFTFPLVNQPNGNGGYKRGDCEWLSKNNATVRKNKYCKETHVYSMCQETCNGYFGDSDITDTPGSNAFKLKIGTSVPCSWLSNNWKKREERRAAYCVDSSICEMASEVGTKCPVACGFTEGYHEYRSCPKSEEEPVIAAIPTPPTASVPAAPSAPSKGSTTGTASSPTKGSTTGAGTASAPTKGYVSITTASSGKGLSKGNSYGKGNSKGSTGRRLRSGYLRK